MTNPNPIDHSGRAFLHRGDLYYSPNCSRRVYVPEYVEQYHYPFHGRDAKYEYFLEPRWWTRPYHYLSFIPLRPSFDGDVFGVLREFVTSVVPVGVGYGLAQDKFVQWQRLENSLLIMARLLNKHYPVHVRGALRPTLPSTIGFSKTFLDLRTARFRIGVSRDWFLMWMGMISSNMADVFSMRHAEDIKDWFSILTDENVPQAWLSSVQSSFICNFSPMHPRVGTFLNISNPHPRQPSVQWFLKFGIPVWYRWEPGNSKLDYLAPPAHALQSATTYISKTPSQQTPILPAHALQSATTYISETPSQQTPILPASSPLPESSSPHRPEDYSNDEYKNAQNAYLASKPWEAYFAAREEKNKKIIANESSQARMTRLNRERIPPTVSCEVYEWEWSEDGSIELVRTSVPKKMREETLARYSNAQSRYDSVRNVWDVCEYFGEDDDDSDDDDPFFSYGPAIPAQDLNKAAEESEAFIEQRTDEVQQESNSDQYSMNMTGHSVGPETNLSHSIGQVDIPQYLKLYYGFLHAIPIPATDPHPTDAHEWAESLKCIGLDVEVNPPVQGLSSLIVDFIKGMQQQSGPRASDWDLRADNYNPLNMSTISESFRKLPNGHFLLNSSSLRADVQSEWHIALSTSVSTLYVARYLNNSPQIPSIEELAQHLAEEGIPFHTYVKLDSIPSSLSLSAILTPIPRRLANYKFTPADYEAYVSDRRRLLSTPRGRAAILQGGIIGRLARETLGIDGVLSGPSSAVSLYRLGCSVEASGATYWDDALTKDEMSVVCGMFHCYTGNLDQTAMLSWWPLPEYWDQSSNSLNWGHWTEWNERWYQEHLSKIQEGKVIPLSHKQWRAKLKSASSWRKVTKFISTHSDEKCQAIPSV